MIEINVVRVDRSSERREEHIYCLRSLAAAVEQRPPERWGPRVQRRFWLLGSQHD